MFLQSDINLQNIYEPEAVQFSFDTIGWKIMAVILLLIVLTITFFVIKKYIKNKYRREAISRLTQTQSIQDILVIVKQVCMQTYGRQTTADLHGNQWFSFLDSKVKSSLFIPLEKEVLNALYQQKEISLEVKNQLLSNSKKWIKTHA